jgi:trimethylamine:corrinoid methyltransferase-like protein
MAQLLREDEMQDSVRGVVTNILGRDTFEMQIIDTGIFNENKYNNPECIRIAGINDPELYPGRHAGEMEKLKNREVRCFIMAIDSNGAVVAVVQCIN